MARARIIFTDGMVSSLELDCDVMDDDDTVSRAVQFATVLYRCTTDDPEPS